MGLQLSREGQHIQDLLADYGRSYENERARSRSKTIPTGSETVLLVEYEQELRTAVRDFLRSTGYTVLEASNGMEALQICQGCQGRIDLLLTDYITPGLSGPRLGTLAMKQQPNLRIICMSGYADRVTHVPDSCKTITSCRSLSAFPC